MSPAVSPAWKLPLQARRYGTRWPSRLAPSTPLLVKARGACPHPRFPALTCPLSVSSTLGKVYTKSCTRIRLWAPMSLYYLFQIMHSIDLSSILRNTCLRRLPLAASQTMIDIILLSHNQISGDPQTLPLFFETIYTPLWHPRYSRVPTVPMFCNSTYHYISAQ